MGSSLSVLAYSVVGEGLSVWCSVALGTSSFKVIMHDRPDGLHDMDVWRQTPPIGPGAMDWLIPVFLNTKSIKFIIINFTDYCVI